MFKKTYRVNVYGDAESRLDELQSWLEDMAQNGRHFVSADGMFVKFEKGEPKNTRYRVEFFQEDEARIELYKESGWNLVHSFHAVHYFSAPDSPDIPELHTDPVEQYHLMERAGEKHFPTWILVCAAIGLVIWMHWDAPHTVLNWMEGHADIDIPMVMLMALGYIVAGMDSVHGKRLKETLRQGKPLERKVKGNVVRNMMCAILVLFPLCFFGGQFLLGQFVSQTEYYTLESTTINLPFARLSDVEHSADLVLDHETSDVSTYWDGIQQSIIATMNAHYAEKQDSDWMSKKAIAHGISSPGAYYETWQNSVVRCRFDTHESGVVVGKNWPNGDRPYNPWITSRVYQLRIPVLQRFLVQDLIHEYGVTVTGKYLTKAYKSSVFNELYVSENGATKELFGYKGGTVVYSLYEGTAGMDEFVKAAESRISK